MGGTYTATIVIRWLRLLSGMQPVVETAGLTPLVNGNDLSGWEGDRKLWSAQDGVLIGLSAGLNHNEFLATTRSYGDFILALDFRLLDGKGNSGVQFRSVRVPPHEMSGYQADIGEAYWGVLYDESRRNKILVAASENAVKALNKTDWNHYTVRAQGDRITLALNGKTSVNYHETEPGIARTGLLGVQIHAGGPTEVKFQNMLIQALPMPASGDSTGPGFHLRTVKVGDQDRKYAVYVPEGHDGSKAFPVILFLHGGGEKGEDGVVPAQVGLGPAILHRPGGLPALVVFPQARENWAVGSADMNGALAALDDVIATCKADTKRVVLTGPSMGGRGTWELAAAHPERFAAVVPVCAGPARDIYPPQEPAGLVILRRRRPCRHRARHAGHDRKAPRGRWDGADHRVPGGRPLELGPRLQRPRSDRLDARTAQTLSATRMRQTRWRERTRTLILLVGLAACGVRWATTPLCARMGGGPAA